MLRIKLIRSTVAHQWRTQRVVESLGLRKINQVVEHEATPNIIGMVHRVKELLFVEEVEGTPKARTVSRPGGSKNVKKAKPVKVAKVAPVKAKVAPAKETKPKAAASKAPAATAKPKVTSEEKAKKPAAKKTEKK